MENQTTSHLEEVLQILSTLSLEAVEEEGYPEVLVMQTGAKTVRIRKTSDGFQVIFPEDPQVGDSFFSEVYEVRDFLFSERQEGLVSPEAEDGKAISGSSRKADITKGILLFAGLIILLVVWARNFQSSETMSVALPEYEVIKDQGLIADLNAKWMGAYYSQPQEAFVLQLKAGQKAEFYPQLPGAVPVEALEPYDFHFGRAKNQTVIVIPELGIFVPAGENTLNFEYEAFVRKPVAASEAETAESQDS